MMKALSPVMAPASVRCILMTGSGAPHPRKNTRRNSIMATMRVAQLSGAKQKFEIVERPIPEPTPGTVRIKVDACGICHSDSLVKEGLWPGIQYPRVPGHEVAGSIDAVGAGVTGWSPR